LEGLKVAEEGEGKEPNAETQSALRSEEEGTKRDLGRGQGRRTVGRGRKPPWHPSRFKVNGVNMEMIAGIVITVKV
jgi:hypothetical protein